MSSINHASIMRKTLCLAIIIYTFCDSLNACVNTKDDVIKMETEYDLGGHIKLNIKEAAVNNCLMHYKLQELDHAFDNPQDYMFSKHYFTYKNKIRESKVYQIIRDLPKGSVLHVHDMGILGPDYIMNITTVDNLYLCIYNNQFQFKFADTVPNTTTCNGKWQSMAEIREEQGKDFDDALRKRFTLVVEDPITTYPCIQDTWNAFMSYFMTVEPLLTYRPIWEQYFYDALKLFREHNVMYVEVRSLLPNLYELDGTVYDPLFTAKTYSNVIKRFVNDYPDFFGAKLIYAPLRNVNNSRVDQYIQLAKRIKREIPEHFAGFDLVGQEDLGRPLKDFYGQLQKAKYNLKYFFHAGETNWFGFSTDENIIDAVLLKPHRIGHGYALPKHPLAMQIISAWNIGVEVCVISNTVLSLVDDVRNHPLSIFLAYGLPVVLSSDDPGVWEADPISEDFYVAFVGAASRTSDLRLLKKLALNSIRQSAFNSAENFQASRKFQFQWNNFIDNFNCSSY